MWDRDTLADEAKGHGDIVDVITGRFPRNPPLYYEMRLERVASEIGTEPDKLELYDDAGVACDRLGRGDEAIEWMAKKREALERAGLASKHDHWYRYHANLGTFLAHEWFRNGKDFSDMADLEKGAEHIRKALEINPDAHFGREEYQLKFMEWVLAKPEAITNATLESSAGEFPNFLNLSEPFSSSTEVLNDASKGISGLIILGNAWESIDAFVLLGKIHAGLRNASISELARSRAMELAGDGIKPVANSDVAPEALQMVINRSSFAGEPKHPFDYNKLRANADAWHGHRTSFMLEKLNTGEHPDTHPAFWEGYEEVTKIKLPVTSFFQKFLEDNQDTVLRLFFGVVLLVFAALIAGILYGKIRRRRLGMKESGAGDRT